MVVRLYNSLTRQREEFTPLNPPRVGMYVCGPTVYGHSHLGHAKSYVSFDAIVRWLRTPPPLGPGFDVNYVQNITDVGHLTDDADEGEDKVVAEARRRGLHPMAVVETFMRSYLDDMDALNNTRPDIMPRATAHIPEQIELTRQLIARGHAYEVNGSVYFSVASFPDYGKLSGRKFEEMEAGARVAVNTEKRNPADFALWKRAEEGHIMRWPSPWGEGFPGWHLECSAMSQKYLGLTFDIHGGGLENQFPHHECEIAQSEAAHGVPFVRYWLHNNMCTLEGQKMGKSLGNSISLKDVFYGREGGVRDKAGNVLLERTFEPVVVRHFILTSHYRQTLDFSSDALHGAESGSYKLRDAARELHRAAHVAQPPSIVSADPSRDRKGAVSQPVASGDGGKATSTSADREQLRHAKNPLPYGRGSDQNGRESNGPPTPLPSSLATSDAVRGTLAQIEQRFAEAMNEDFNTAAAIATLFDLAKRSGEWLRDGAAAPSAGRGADLLAADTLMQHLAGDVLGFHWPAALGGADNGKQDDLIRLLIDLRAEARKKKDFALGDQIRQRLSALGVELRDGPQGTTW